MKKGIGIFDSGLGGLTVVKEVIKQLPAEDIYYLGDTAHVPYGTKSEESVKKFTLANLKFLTQYPLKLIIIACNTASAIALNEIKQNFNIPIIGVINPSVEKAIISTKNKKIGVIGTSQTIRSKIYQKEILSFSKEIKVFEKSCPLFVPLVEEGWLEQKITFLIIRKYLASLKRKNIDTLILGCTHYPLLKNIIQKVMGEKVTLVDSAIFVAQKAKKNLAEKKLLSFSKKMEIVIFLLQICQ
ncbi:MAG: glutamate racemase [bacterium]